MNGLRIPDLASAVRGRFRGSLRDDERTAAVLGIALGLAFTVCFLTGLYSHLAQHPTSWFHVPPRPAGLYRFTQGLHVATGIATIPLLLAKLWVVYPKLFAWPPFTSVAHAVERVTLVPLVGGGLFMVFSGLANINLWYPWQFNFPIAHYSVAWITIGALVVHIGAKYSVTRAALARQPTDDTEHTERTASSAPSGTVDRRQFLGAVFGTSGLLMLFTVGQTFTPLSRLALLAPRRPDVGPQGFPVNRTARAAGVVDTARSPAYRLTVTGRVRRPLELDLASLHAMARHSATLPIACVEGWSASRRWTGIRVRDLLVLAGAAPGASVRVESLQRRRSYRSSHLDADQAHDVDTLLATHVDGEVLALDHGYPLRLIAPNRPGVLQTKWVTRLVVR